jgi:hypothetical protein
VRIFADENVPRRAFKAFAELVQLAKPSVESSHLLGMLAEGTPDDVWIAEVSKADPPWLVVSGDSAKNTRSSDPRAPAILPQLGVTAIFLSGKLQQKPAFEKVRALLYVFPEIVAAYQGPRGTRYRLVAIRTGYALNEWPLKTKVDQA